MQALVLAGGEGTRLRPLTHTTPKPVLPLAGRPFLSFMLDWAHRHGVDDVILSCGFLSDAVRDVLGDIYNGMRLRYVIEEEPLGTAGPVRLAYDQGLLDERFLVLNGDVLTDMDLDAELEQHERSGARVTIALVRVEDTSSYGVVVTGDDGRVEAFLEKTGGEAPTNLVNAGAYTLERDVVELIPPGRAVSFERETFQELVGDGLYGWASGGYWMDIGTAERYLEATYDLLAGRVESDLPPRDETGSLVYDGSLVSGAHIGPQAVLGRHCSVGTDTTVERSVLHDRVIVGADCEIRESVDALSREAIEAVDPDGMLGDVLAQVLQLGDALWRVQSAGMRSRDLPGGLAVCGMGGSAIGGDLALAVLGDRATRPLRIVRDYALPPWAGQDTMVMCSSYSGDTEETLAAFEAAGIVGAPRVAVTTGGRLAELARAEDVPVIGVPAGMRPRAAVLYSMVAALECAALCGAGPQLHTELDAATTLLERLVERWGPDSPEDSLAKRLARELQGTLPVITGAELTAPLARRWKTQLNENPDMPAFWSELPEADHNEISGWERGAKSAPFAAVFLADSDQHPRLRRRIKLTCREVERSGGKAIVVESEGETRLERVLSLLLLGDLVSVYLAVLDGVDPSPMPAIDRLKAELDEP